MLNQNTKLQDVVNKISEKTGSTKVAAREMLDTVTEVIQEMIASKEYSRVSIPGLVSFILTEKEARTGRNPRTGEEIDIPAHTHVRASVATVVKDSVK